MLAGCANSGVASRDCGSVCVYANVDFAGIATSSGIVAWRASGAAACCGRDAMA